MKKSFFILFCLVMLVLTGCTRSVESLPTSRAFNNPNQNNIPTHSYSDESTDITLRRGESLQFSGESVGTQQLFSMDSFGTVRIYWEHSGEEVFLLSIINQDPAMAGTRFGAVTIELAVGPSSGVKVYTFIPGNYILEVEETDGSWEVWLETSDTIFPNVAEPGEVIRVSGSNHGYSESFVINQRSVLQISWKQASSGTFLMVLNNFDMNNINYQFGPPIIEENLGSSEGSTKIMVEPGIYTIDVQIADGSWEIWAEVVEILGNP